MKFAQSALPAKAYVLAVLLVAAVLAAFVFGSGFGFHDSDSASVSADTENCASAGEYDQLHDLMGLGDVRQLFDIPGRDEGDTFDGQGFRYSFNACDGLAGPDNERIWCRFSYDGSGLYFWRLR